MAADSEQIVRIASMTVSALAVIFNAIGLYTLSQINFRNSNQIIIIKSLSITDIIIAIGWISGDVLNIYGHKSGSIPWNINWSLRAGVYLTWYAMIYMLTMDRFLGCNFPLQHRVWVRMRNIKIAVITMWMIGVISGISMCLLEDNQLYTTFNKLVWLLLDGTFLTLFLITYSTIYYNVSKTGVQRNIQTDQNKFFRMITAILLCFVIFEIVPLTTNFIFFMATNWGTTTLRSIIVICYNVNMVADPLIYIFLQPQARHLVFYRFSKRTLKGKLCSFNATGEHDLSQIATTDTPSSLIANNRVSKNLQVVVHSARKLSCKE
eukprot:Seg4107.2 transcript_id=Seg4107.2/GoldUCD/mRNA.D3Y31 product="hypothetical protein" protein_id=Seg4107.2/GoldUCD/D3Y31